MRRRKVFTAARLPACTSFLMAAPPPPLRLSGRVGHRPLCRESSWPALPGLANYQSPLINNGRLSPFSGVFTAAVASPGASDRPRRDFQRLARPRRAALRGRLAASRPGAGGVVPHPPCRAGVTSLSPSRSSTAAPRSQTPPLPPPLPLPRRSPTSPRGFVTNLSQAHRVRSQTTTLAHQPPRAAATPPGPLVSASLICMPSCRSPGRASLEPGTDHSPRPQIIRNTQVESQQQLFFQRRRQRGARTGGAAGESEP